MEVGWFFSDGLGGKDGKAFKLASFWEMWFIEVYFIQKCMNIIWEESDVVTFSRAKTD